MRLPFDYNKNIRPPVWPAMSSSVALDGHLLSNFYKGTSILCGPRRYLTFELIHAIAIILVLTFHHNIEFDACLPTHALTNVFNLPANKNL